MISELSVFLRGSCRFSANGMFPERFLNLCANADMGLWDIRRTDGGLSARVVAGRYRRLRRLAKKCGLLLRITEKRGLPFRLIPYRKRAGMPLGFLVFCGMLYFLSLFVWSVELPNTTPELTATLSEALDEMGLTVGSLRSRVEGNRMSVELQMRVPELSWAGISSRGSRVIVEIKELEIVPKPLDNAEPCNIVASKSGIISSISLVDGEIVVSPGQTVVTGDLLVSGVVDRAGRVEMLHAEAEVFARIEHTFTCTIDLDHVSRERTGKAVKLTRLKVFGLEMPLFFGDDPNGDYEREISKWQLSIGDFELPLETRTEILHEMKNVKRRLSLAEAEALAAADIERQKSRFSKDEIVSENTTVSYGDNSVTIQCEATVIEDIAVSNPILIQ